MLQRKNVIRIVFIDSGFGGLLLSSHIRKIFPDLQIIFIGDTLNMPYGEKSVDFLNQRYNVLQKKAKQMGADLLVVACNTLSATSHLTQEKLIDTVDIISITIENLNKRKINNLAIVATPNTINSKIYNKSLSQNINLKEISTSNLASLVENDSLERVKEEFQNLIATYEDNILLGCTHYSVLAPYFLDKKIISQDKILEEYLKENYFFQKGTAQKVELFVNSELEKYTKFARNLFGERNFDLKMLDF